MSTSNTNTNNQSAKKNIRFEHDLIEGIESLKDPLIPFAAWVKQACREKLQRDSAPVNIQVPLDKKATQKVICAPTELSEVDSLVMSLTNEQGLSTRKVAARLTELGYKNGDKDYTHNMVNTIIKNNRK